MRLTILITISWFSLVKLNGQNDSILTFQSFIETVKAHHPITYKANNLLASAAARKQIARGGFDPKVDSDWNNKSFEGKNYYAIASGKLKIPSWYGIELGVGYDRRSGDFLNNSDFLPSGGLWNGGISVPLGKGLVIDRRRAELQKAHVVELASEQERKLIINDLLYEASLLFIKWQVTFENLEIASEGLSLAQIRFEGIKRSFVNGDKPSIDTLESFINYQNRELVLQKAIQDFENTRVKLNNFLWAWGETPIELRDFCYTRIYKGRSFRIRS